MLALALFILVGYLYVRRTTHGYRYSLLIIMSGAALISLVLGTLLYAVGFGGEVEEALGDHPPFYRPILIAEQSWWLAPQEGLLGGEVEQVSPNVTSFVLHDFSGKTWNVDTSDLRNRDLARSRAWRHCARYWYTDDRDLNGRFPRVFRVPVDNGGSS